MCKSHARCRPTRASAPVAGGLGKLLRARNQRQRRDFFGIFYPWTLSLRRSVVRCGEMPISCSGPTMSAQDSSARAGEVPLLSPGSMIPPDAGARAGEVEFYSDVPSYRISSSSENVSGKVELRFFAQYLVVIWADASSKTPCASGWRRWSEFVKLAQIVDEYAKRRSRTTA